MTTSTPETIRLTVDPAVCSTDGLDAAITAYENTGGFSALNFRGLRKNASLRARVTAANLDARWYELHSQTVRSQLQRAITEASNNH